MNLFRELKDRKKNGTKAIIITVPTLFTMFIIIGLSGYFCFGDEIQSDILRNLSKEGGVLAYIASSLMILLIICHYPLMAYGGRKAIESLLFGVDKYDLFSKKK